MPGQYIELDTNSNAGGLVMQIQSAGGQVVSVNKNKLATTNPIDSEQLSLDGLTAGTYCLEISGVTTAVTNPEYSLTFLPPQTPTPDYAEPNNVSKSRLRPGQRVGGACDQIVYERFLRHPGRF